VLNSYVDANSLNSGFSAGDTPIGGNGFNGTDNTIKMAARYVRTTGETAPGPANAVVQVIANYE
jgi:type 1 fimbria pilin